MARLDVTDNLLDEDFIDTFAVVPSLVNVDQYGLAQILEQAVPAIGSIQAATSDELMQFGEGDALGGSIKIYTVYPLSAGNAQTGADRILWEGALYTVFNVMSYANFASGKGHVEAIARLASLNPSSVPRADDAGYL